MEDLRQLLVGGVPLVVGIRHEPTEHGAELWRYLGVQWRIDPAAPRCAGPCGRSECSVSAVASRSSSSTARLPVREERCGECPWPDVCALDLTCWRAEGQVEREERMKARHGRVPPAPEVFGGTTNVLSPDPVPEPPAREPLPVAAADYRDADANGKYGCKMPGCEGRSSRTRGPTAFLCDDVHAPAKSEQHRQTIMQGVRRREAETPREAKPDRSWLHVPGTGLKYRTPQDALEAADAIEADGQRVAKEARAEGKMVRAEQALEAALPLAEKVRAAAHAAIGVEPVAAAEVEAEAEPARDGTVEVPPGVIARHSRVCATREGGDCTCEPSWQAWVWSREEGRKIRQTFASLDDALAWRSGQLGGSGGLFSPRVRLALAELLEAVAEELRA